MTVYGNDDELMERLARSVDASDPVPDEVVAAGKAAFLARNLDQELAELLYDSATDGELVLTRGDTARSMSFATEKLSVELEVDEQQGRIMGQLVPPQIADVDLELDGLVVGSTQTDDLGRFRFDAPGSGVVTLVCRAAGAGLCMVRFEL